MGNQLLSLRGERWRGQTTLAPSDRGERRFLRLRNCYVNHDGSEIRQWPGSVTLLDLTAANNANGYERYIEDAVLPLFSTSPTEEYQFEYGGDPPAGTRLTLMSRAKPTHIHGFEQIQGQLILFGESRFRENPIYNTARTKLTVINVADGGGVIVLTLSGNPAADSASDSVGAGLNGLAATDVVFCESVTLTAPAPGEQALVDTKLNRRVHQITSIVGAVVTLQTTALGLAAGRVATGEIHVVSFNRSNTYDNVNGLSPYNSDAYLRIDDPTSLTSWRVVAPLAIGASAKDCFPAWVANRQRDFGDSRPPRGAEGILTSGAGGRGTSRREKRELPFRLNPESATDRLILAAPQYGCLFQIPIKVPIDPGNDGRGIDFQPNDVHDRPRALGVPKARMVESYHTTPPGTPTEVLAATFDLNLWMPPAPAHLLTANGLPPGEYQVAISWEDAALGEEGLASEVRSVTVPNNARCYSLLIPYIHPGYVMPECLAFHMNVYIATPGTDDLSFYGKFSLAQLPLIEPTINNTNSDMSGKYGFLPVTPTAPYTIHRYLALPLPADGTALTDVLDPERQAPQSAAMPRGAEAVRYVRGVMLSGGHTGNVGTAGQLWAAKASSQQNQSTWDREDEVQIRVHGDTPDLSASAGTMDGDVTTDTLGNAGRAFPSAYQGIEFVHRDLLPAGVSTHRVDRVLNRMAETLTGAQRYFLFRERLRLTRDAWGRTRAAGVTPTAAGFTGTGGRDIWYVEPRGQLAVADPGAPNRSSPLFIQFIDPNRGEDITAIGRLGGTGVICTRNETYTFSWYRNPGSEIPALLHNEFGCVAANSMVEFDGGVAWMSARGPVAIGGNGIQHIGDVIEGDFVGAERRYEFDSRGMMRHCWSAHDAERGLVMWGLVTTDSTHTMTKEFVSGFAWASADDELRSRFPCNEVLVWSYKTGAFSTWRPPSGLEILWMRPVVVGGKTYMSYLAADQRIYALSESAHDCVNETLTVEFPLATEARTATTTLTWSTIPTGVDGSGSARDAGINLRPGLSIEFLNSDGQLFATSSVLSVQASGVSTSITMTSAVAWPLGTTVRVAPRQRMVVVSTFLGGETKDQLRAANAQIRYTLRGGGTANWKASWIKTDKNDDGAQVPEIQATDPDLWDSLGESQGGLGTIEQDGYRNSHRRVSGKGGASGPEIALKLEFTGSAQVRVADIALEVA